jgi:hypothetical protein
MWQDFRSTYESGNPSYLFQVVNRLMLIERLPCTVRSSQAFARSCFHKEEKEIRLIFQIDGYEIDKE